MVSLPVREQHFNVIKVACFLCITAMQSLFYEIRKFSWCSCTFRLDPVYHTCFLMNSLALNPCVESLYTFAACHLIYKSNSFD